MDYFSILELNREPFSNSPDPAFFFQSRQHQGCLQRMELALRLRRGLNVVIGDVGTGKTTLCRQLIRRFSEDPDMETHLILDPDFSAPADLLQAVAAMFAGSEAAAETDPWQLKEKIKSALYKKGVEQKKTVVLIIDEGQKIPGRCLELLREFLNYETNEYKLLQIAIFAQPEFENSLANKPNFADRINVKHVLGPMGFRDTRDMIRYRLSQSSEAGHRKNLFTLPGIWAIYRATGGYPRKIVHLCHQCLLAVIIQNRRKAGWALVRSCSRRAEGAERSRVLRPALLAMMLLVLAAAAVFLAPIPGVELPAAWRQALVPSGESRQRPPAGSGPVKMKVSGAKIDTPTPAPAAGRPSGVVPAADRTTAPAAAGSDPPADLSGRAPERTGAAAKRDGGDPPERSGTKDSGRRADPGSAPEEPLAAASAEDAAAQPPEFLGTVILGERETLWRLVEKVYGVFEKDYLKSVLAANPRIRDPNHVELGRGIRLPAIPAAVEPPGRKGWWIRLEQKSGLNDAIEALRRHPKEMPPVRILSYWHPSKGMTFSMMLQERFTDEAAARYEIERLAAASGVKGELVSEWPPETIFYADPWG